MHILKSDSREHLLTSNLGPNKKPNFTCCDHNDVTLGSSAVFQYSVLPGLALVVRLMDANNPTTGSTGTTKTRGFPSPPHDRFGFSSMGSEISRQNGNRPIRSQACTF